MADVPGTAFYFHQDHLSSTAVLTDEYGEVQEHTGYFPDGATWYEKGARRPINGYLFSGKLCLALQKPFSSDHLLGSVREALGE